MARMFRCKHCGRLVKRNPRIKSFQQYCGQAECQGARKNAWRREKNENDEGYRTKRRVSNKRWRDQHQAHSYHKRYRETHPEYAAQNRQMQQKRNEKRKVPDPGTKIVKSDALSPEKLIKAGLYELLQYKNHESEKIVKSDALMVQLSILQSGTAVSLQQSR